MGLVWRFEATWLPLNPGAVLRSVRAAGNAELVQ